MPSIVSHTVLPRESVYFVTRRQVLLGHYPLAQPVLIVDGALAHRYIGVRSLDVIDSPLDPDKAPRADEALALFAIDRREWVFYEGAQPAVIVRDERGAPRVGDSSPW